MDSLCPIGAIWTLHTPYAPPPPPPLLPPPPPYVCPSYPIEPSLGPIGAL